MKRSSSEGEHELLASSSKIPRLGDTSTPSFQSMVLSSKSRGIHPVKPPHVHHCRRKHCCPESLTVLAAKVTAANVPFELVEERCPRVPEPVLMKLITWSFPRSESDIQRYSAINCKSTNVGALKSTEYRVGDREEDAAENDSTFAAADRLLCSDGNDTSDQEDTFQQGVALATGGAVTESIQIGFHLSGVVTEKNKENNSSSYSNSSPYHVTNRSFNVAVTFDRCKVTSSRCNCQFGDGVFFCRHVVAVLLYRLRNPTKVKIRSPISDSLQQLNRDQLQKLTQYLVTRHSSILPTAQEIADLFCDPASVINKLHGAPDPTAGASYRDDDRWSLEERHVTRHIRNVLVHPNKQFAIHSLHNMLKKIREMMRVRDCNGTRLLTLTTSELLRGGGALETCSLKEAYHNLWDDIASLWVCTVLNPNNGDDKGAIISQLQTWHEDARCPTTGDSNDFTTSNNTSRSVLSRAITAGSMDWNDPHLETILRSGKDACGWMNDEEEERSGSSPSNSRGQPLWCEQTEMACARVEALRCHGYVVEAVRLAVAVARTIKEECRHPSYKPSSEGEHNSMIGNPLEPIPSLFDTLTFHHSPEVEERLGTYNGYTRNSLKHEAFEVCLLKLGQQRYMPMTSRAQEKVMSCERKLIERLNKLEVKDDMITSMKKIVLMLLDGDWESGLGLGVHSNSVPMHAFATYLFKTLLPHDRKLAFRIGLRSMRMPILDSEDSTSASASYLRRIYLNDTIPEMDDRSGVLPLPDVEPVADHMDAPERNHRSSYPSHWTEMEDLEWKQYNLALNLLQAAKGEAVLLKLVVRVIQRHIRNSSHVFQLSRVVFKNATNQNPSSISPDPALLNVAMQLVMQVLRMTLERGSWQRREMVGWLVTCATEIGLRALLLIIKGWSRLFTAVEACTVVAACVISPNTAMRLNLDPRQREDLYHSVCKMTEQCAKKDPQSCALCSLTLCETCPSAFDEVYHIIVEAADKRQMDSQQLFTTARYLDQRGIQARAFTVAYRATMRLRVPFNHDSHPAATDLLWTTQLAQSLGLQELEDLILIIINKVRCPSVLSDVLRTCTSSVNGRMTNYMGAYGNRGLRADRPPLRPLLEAAIAAYINAIHSKLSHISPRHYTEFINFLNKARETFLLAPDGHFQFARLLANLKTIYKGKKKLLNLVAIRFG